MNNECNNKHTDANGITYRCRLQQGHQGSHYDHHYRRTWPSSQPYSDWFKAEYKTGVLGDFPCAKVKGYGVDKHIGLVFTAHELAELYVILSGNHDIPAVYLNKVAAALKEAL